ncbi:hypothetical protein LSAT2_023051 [Lamellibrachia satsuma]|nr:hypothetical protein LSAT2_023051 [Lamellibrachia satsuma]
MFQFPVCPVWLQARSVLQVQLRGMILALTAIIRHCGADLPDTIPALWQAMFNPLETYTTNTDDIAAEADNSTAQQLVNSLQVLEVTMSSFHPKLHAQLQSRLPQLIACLKHRYTAVRHMAARCLGNLGKILTAETMTCVIETVLPLLDASHTIDIQREGAIEAMANLIEQLGVALVPYLVLLVVPLLGRMSDHNIAVRLMASQCFATLIRLIPLEAGIPNPPAMKNSLVEQKERDRRFIEQLLDGSKLEVHDILVPIKAELRKYQQDGVNWLAFLNKYKLHGILCDDMGLGKTLQSICILASDHRKHKLEHERTGDVPPLPSIVLCPPTLTGHWMYEVEKFVSPDFLHPLHYTGPPLERIKLRKLVKKHNLVVASYDVVRNDIDFFSTIKWNYCILDEGHIIKNSKTKLSRAVKQLNCRHRLILSGTPIQNNVLELWSLFDFLLPGFLGSEKQFQVRYGRPIVASRDAKSSSKEQEAGALAMEALHRQVLPFILRRLKEDVLHDLPPKIIQDYYCDLSSLQMKLYEDFAKSRVKKSMEDHLSEGEKSAKAQKTERPTKAKKESGTVCTHVFQALQYLRKVCDHPALVITKQHPQYPQLMDDLRQQGSNLHDLQHAPKLIALKQLMSDCGIGVDLDDTETPVVNQHRALIFCQLKSMLDIVEKDLLKAHMSNVSYLRLDGSVPTANRHSIVTRFNNDPSIDLLLLTTHVGGLGLNLTGADTVIFVEHDWNPMKDLQAMDRAHRIGQKKVVNVYRLITRGTLEEKIMGLQKFKMNIANSVISADNASLSSMATDQLLDLFSVNEDKMAASIAKTEASTTTRQNAQTVIEGLEELWDEKQYETEYDLGEFLSELKH